MDKSQGGDRPNERGLNWNDISDEQLLRLATSASYEIEDPEEKILYKAVQQLLRSERPPSLKGEALLHRINLLKQAERQGNRGQNLISPNEAKRRRDQEMDQAAYQFSQREKGNKFTSNKAVVTFNTRNDFDKARGFLERQRGFRISYSAETRGVPPISITSESLIPQTIVDEIRRDFHGVVEPR